MGEHYVIHLTNDALGWHGILSGRSGEVPFEGREALLQLLDGPAIFDGEMECMHQALLTDALTGVLNRRGLDLAVCEALAQKTEGVALLFLDVDDLKRINDTWGHLCGDRVLCMVAETIAACVGERDVVGRIGGDEFVVLMSGAFNGELLRARGGQICRAVVAVGAEFQLSVSVGAVSGAPGCSYEQLLERADRAMYQIKGQGKNGCALYEEGLPPHTPQNQQP